MEAVTHGADTTRLRRIAETLHACADDLNRLEADGSTGLAVLDQAWAGDDAHIFAADWQQASTSLITTADRLQAFARQLTEHADQQDTASTSTGATGGTGTGTVGTSADGGRTQTPGTSRRPDPDGKDRTPTTPDPLDLTAGFGITDPLLGKAVDLGTDWANDVYTDHLRPISGIPMLEKGLGESSDWLKDAANKYRENHPWWDPRPIVIDVAADELDMYRDILHDPKGWWDNDATTLDKVGIGLSVIPGLGILGKAVTKTTKEVFDQITDVGRRAPSPSPVWVDDLDKASGLKNSSDPLERGYGENAEHAQKLIEKHDVDQPEDVWKLGNGPRGLVVEALHGGNLPPGFKAVDRWETVDGVDRVVSTKTLDASTPTYDGKPNAIESKLNGYVRDLNKFEEGEHKSPTGNRVEITPDDYDEKVLEVIVRPDSMSSEEWKAVDRVRSRAEKQGIELEVIEYP